MIKAYGLNKCSTCQKALDWLGENKVKVDFTDHVETPPTKAQVAKWSNALGGWEKMVNRAGYTWRGLPKSETEDLTEAKAVALALKHTSLIRRPLIEHEDGAVTVGFSDKIRKMF
jgi:arsenate reductase (glutaredoxin)